MSGGGNDVIIDRYEPQKSKLVKQIIYAKVINNDNIILCKANNPDVNCIVNCTIELNPETYERKYFTELNDNSYPMTINKVIEVYENALKEKEKTALRQNIIYTMTNREIDALGIVLSKKEQTIINKNNDNIIHPCDIFTELYETKYRFQYLGFNRYDGPMNKYPAYLLEFAHLKPGDREYLTTLQFNLDRRVKFGMMPITDLFLNE